MHGTFHLAALLCVAWLGALAGCGQPQSAAQSPAIVTAAVTPSEPAEQSPPAAQLQPAEPAAAQAAAPPAASSEASKGQRPPADRAPSRPGDAEKITFEDLNLGMQADTVFRDFMADPVKELIGKRVSLVGYMHGGQAAQRGIKEFILLKNTQCKFGPGGQADHLANVLLKTDHSVTFTPSPVKVEGTLKLSPFQGPDGNTWSIYTIEDAQIR